MSQNNLIPLNSQGRAVGEAGPGCDLEVVGRAQRGDGNAFAQLYREHKNRVFRICLRIVRNEPLAEDLSQEVFLQVYRKLHTFRQESAFSTWLYRVARNVVFMYLRKRRVPEVSLEQMLQPHSEERPQSELGKLGKEDPWLRSTLDRLGLQAAVAELAPGYRRVFLLHDVMGYEHREVAQAVGCSVGNSKSQLHKARQRLQCAMQLGRAA